jgi:rRNA maturation protein Nop10
MGLFDCKPTETYTASVTHKCRNCGEKVVIEISEFFDPFPSIPNDSYKKRRLVDYALHKWDYVLFDTGNTQYAFPLLQHPCKDGEEGFCDLISIKLKNITP